MSEIIDLSNVQNRYCNKQEAAQFFDVSVPTVNAWIRRGCPVVSRGNQQTPWKLDLLAVAEWRFSSRFTGEGLDPDTLSPFERKAWYESEQRRRQLQVQDRQLVPISEVETSISTAFHAVAQSLRSLPDNIERKLGCDPVIVSQIGENYR